jgi:hypothetical protein
MIEGMEVQFEQENKNLRTTDEIVKELHASKSNGNVIGITALSLGPAMIMTAVEDIIDVRNDKVIVLKDTDLLGIKLAETEILLSEIVWVYPFKTLFDDPFHVQLRERKNDITAAPQA